jgi:hypothetical protein
MKKNLQLVPEKPAAETPLPVFTEAEYRRLIDIELDVATILDLINGKSEFYPVHRLLSQVSGRFGELNEELEERIEKAKGEQ